jgi:hypothetical protein
MSLLNISAVRARAKRSVPYSVEVSSVLQEQMKKQASVSSHDIFLSHAFDDKELILGVALTLEDLGFSVYLDWRDDPSLDRKNVTSRTAAKLRERMKSCKCLFYSTTDNSSSSKWMPWELGFKDGNNSRACILPITATGSSVFKGQEYLGIYPYAVQGKNRVNTERIWIHRSPEIYVAFEDWLGGKEPYKRS